MPEFQHILYLLGLLALVPLTLLFVYVLRWKNKARTALGNPRLVQMLTGNYSHGKYKLKIILCLAAIALIIVAAANLRTPLHDKGTTTAGIDIVFALDVSKSMLSQDEKPNRLEKAKLFINQLCEKLQNNRVGFVVFAGKAYLQMPLTPDASAARMYVSNASTDLVSMQGTVISDALQLCDKSLDTKEKASKAIVLITDGEDHDAKAETMAQTLKDHGTALYTIGVGSIEGSPITEPGTNEYKRDANGETVITKLNQELLQKLATTANGAYFHLTSTTATADQLAAQLDKLEKKPVNDKGGQVAYFLFYPFLLAIAIALLIAEVFISEKRKLSTQVA